MPLIKKLMMNYIISPKNYQRYIHIDKYAAHHRFNDAKDIIKYFNNPPAIDYINDNVQVIPDFFVEINDDIDIKINNAYYPDIKVKIHLIQKNENIKEKLKEAKDLVNLLNLRKSTPTKLY